MSISATYAHTNLIAEDWQALARFYQQVFGCVPVREVDFQGDKLDAGVRIAGHICAASICGYLATATAVRR